MIVAGQSLFAEAEAKTTAIPYGSYLAEIEQFVDALHSSLWPINSYIHCNPELSFQEHKAHNALTSFMELQDGWHVTRSAYNMETAWAATYDSGRAGPVVALNAEMDALPDMGHACGHNLIAMVSVAAGLAAADVLQRHRLPGSIRIIGTPAEESGGGKIKCLEAGAYNDADVSMISHPGIINNSAMVCTTAFVHLDVTYRGRTAHAARSPWLGINALDALVVAYNAISALRQQTHPDDVIGLQITDGGNKPNVIHAQAAGTAVLRAATATRLQELQNKVQACFRAGAEATGAEVEITIRPGYKDHVPNRVLAASYRRYWVAMKNPPKPDLPQPEQVTWVKASTDQGDVSYALPSMNVSFAIPPGPAAGQPHSPDFEYASGTKDAFATAMRVAKAMAGTAVEVCSKPGMLQEVQEQWRLDMI
ncbi:peptidase m20 domain containing 2 [Ophiostoma piceae UAMH 11346]|uniref:Peptidase M20 domain-containing protein 2 n=1 Tax=Ophiostoma piceae (strain UAMH 11346) TaxID=1262450 RepID=S3C3K7_OPHP1|nr:peptidase m20 domain containing 2 [Ophiostoma piceae UAMH 11346]